jgi:uncharacterized protein
MRFKLKCTKPVYDQNTNEFLGTNYVDYYYDNQTSEVFDHNGKLVNVKPTKNMKSGNIVEPVSINTPKAKSNKIKTLKIQLGLSCNYSCEYCSQRFVPNIEHSNTKLIDKFVANMDNWLVESPNKIEFWGGEPFVYWKILKPLAEKIREKFPTARFSVITNGSMITEEIIEWLYNMNFALAVSHDGPGQNVRGPDPFEDPEKRKMLFKLFNRFLPEGRISINSMIHRENMDRAKIQRFFEDLFNLNSQDRFFIGEGGFIDVYDEGGKKNVPQNLEEHVAHRRKTLEVIKNGSIGRFHINNSRISEWLDSWGNYRNADTLGQKCGMDDEDTIAVDLMGNVLTCQNVTAVSKAPNGKSHRIGHVNQFDKIKLNTATHWKFREECSKCPVLQICKGSCMFLQGEYFKMSCDAAYSDHIPFFSAAFEVATGAIPYQIIAVDDNYSLPTDREDLWGEINKVNFVIPEIRQEATALEGKK